MYERLSDLQRDMTSFALHSRLDIIVVIMFISYTVCHHDINHQKVPFVITIMNTRDDELSLMSISYTACHHDINHLNVPFVIMIMNIRLVGKCNGICMYRML